VSSAANKCKSVLLPAPDGPTMAIISPRFAEKSIPSSGVISSAPDRKILRRRSARRISAELGTDADCNLSIVTPALVWLCITAHFYHTLDAELPVLYVLLLLATSLPGSGILSKFFSHLSLILPYVG
jgi:hypothetical protein